jgi:hypothetical protein
MSRRLQGSHLLYAFKKGVCPFFNVLVSLRIHLHKNLQLNTHFYVLEKRREV